MKSDSSRPEDFLELVQRLKRGRLKVYLGFAAGVGKTYRMLEEAHALKKRGVDVVIGYVETHGRVETAALVDRAGNDPPRRASNIAAWASKKWISMPSWPACRP